ncbi:MAG: DUF4034 domain-containing protein [Dokdonella sp.]
MLAAAALATTTSVVRAMSLDEVFAQPEQEQRRVLEDTVGRWFLAEDFAHIENFAETARAKGLRTSSGLWVGGFASAGIDSVANFHEVKDDAGWDRLEAIAQRWIAAYPSSATAKIAYALILQNRAWLYRGGGYANTVSTKQFAAFYKQIEKAKQYQLATRDLAGVDPDWYLTFLATLRVEKHGRREEFEQTFADAIRAFPDYYPMYFEAVTYYLPKWNGDAYEVEHFARRVMKGRDERTGRMLYARIYWFASQNQFKNAIFLASVARWDDMRAGFEAIVSEYPDQWNINHYAKFACLVGDKDTTKVAFGMIKGEPIAAAWASTEQYEKCRYFAGLVST